MSLRTLFTAALLLAAACGPDRGAGKEETAEGGTASPASGVSPAATEQPALLNPSEVGAALEARYPPALKDAGIGGTTVLAMRIDQTGRVTERSILTSSGRRELDDAALEIAGEMRFSPARAGGAAVPVRVEMPIQFQVR